LSAGELFELLRPAVFLFSAILSAWVLASARRRGIRPIPVALWTIGTLVAPPVAFPLFLAWRIFTNRKQQSKEARAVSEADSSEPDESESAQPSAPGRYRFLLPWTYLLLVIAIGVLYFYRDSHSIDAYLSRGNAARIMNSPERTIAEYRAALRLEDNPHTHNLLGRELAEQKRWSEALTELEMAKAGNEPDPVLPYVLAVALEQNGREDDAEEEFKQFLNSSPCHSQPPDPRCENARLRLAALSKTRP
jgi:tetratricopeptide (TPR) repeat protein